METANKQLAAKECEGSEENRKTISQLLAQSEWNPPVSAFRKVFKLILRFHAATTGLLSLIAQTAHKSDRICLVHVLSCPRLQ